MKKLYTAILAIIAMALSANAEEPLYTATGTLGAYDGWSNLACVFDEATYGVIKPTVEAYDGYVIVRAFAGVEGYDMKVGYDADGNLNSITPIVNDVADDEVTKGYVNVYTGLTGESDYCMQPYIGSGYGYVSNLTSSQKGYVLTVAYLGDLYGQYYCTWDASGIEAVSVDTDAPAVYYNLQGVRVENPSGGVYIKRQGNTVTKVEIR